MENLLILKHIEYENHAEHWSKLDSGMIHITSYCPANHPSTGVLQLKPNEAIKGLKRMLKEGWIIMSNDLFPDVQ